MQKLNSRQEKALETKKKLLASSLELVRTHGYDNVSVIQICQHAGVSVGAFYHHLNSKEGIVIEGYAECDDYFDNVVIKQLKSENCIDRILEYLQHQSKYAEDYGLDLTTQIYKAQINYGTEFFLSDERALPKNLLKLIESAQENGDLTAGISATEIRDEILIITRGIIYNWCQNKGGYNLSRQVNNMASRYLVFFQTKPANKSR